MIALGLMPERVCGTCTNQVLWGCDAVETEEPDPFTGGKLWAKAAMLPLVIDDEEVWRCPRRPIKDDPSYWQRLLLFFKHYREGHLPDAGPVVSQSFRALTLFGVLEDTITDVDREKAERAAAKGRRG